MGKKVDISGWIIKEHGVPDSRLKVIREHGKDKYGSYLWECECSCGSGKIVIAHARDLLSGNTKSCGCFNKERIKETLTKHGDSNNRLYRVWMSMLQRTRSPKCKDYKYYGGRGIKVCEEWKDYNKFKEWSLLNGYDFDAKQGTYTIERNDVNGDYCPENCRWATQLEQANNKRNNVVLKYSNEEHTMAEWSRIAKIDESIIQTRLRLGWSIEDALTIKPHNGHYVECEGKKFNSIKACANYYKVKYTTMKAWLNGNNPMPQEWINKGLKVTKELMGLAQTKYQGPQEEANA